MDCAFGVQFVLRTFNLSFGRSICPSDVQLAFGVQVARAFGRLPVIPFLIEHGFDGFSRIMDTSLFDIQHSTFDILTGDRW